MRIFRQIGHTILYSSICYLMLMIIMVIAVICVNTMEGFDYRYFFEVLGILSRASIVCCLIFSFYIHFSYTVKEIK